MGDLERIGVTRGHAAFTSRLFTVVRVRAAPAPLMWAAERVRGRAPATAGARPRRAAGARRSVGRRRYPARPLHLLRAALPRLRQRRRAVGVAPGPAVVPGRTGGGLRGRCPGRSGTGVGRGPGRGPAVGPGPGWVGAVALDRKSVV